VARGGGGVNLQPEAFVLAGLGLAALSAAAWWLRGRRVRELRGRCERLQSASADKEVQLVRTLERCDELEGELSGLHAKLGQEETRIGQLRDLVKVHVARRREFDEWANPIRATLGESVSQTLRSLKEQIAQQEFALQRQTRLVADADAQFKRSREELDRMRRELTLKNYHIAALNERFIRVEERMQELGTQVAAIGTAAGSGDAPLSQEVTPETARFSLEQGETRDWMQVLDDWHRQLHDRLDRMDRLQAQLRSGGTQHPSPVPRRSGDLPS